MAGNNISTLSTLICVRAQTNRDNNLFSKVRIIVARFQKKKRTLIARFLTRSY